jgi:hypothetical protein
MASGTIPGRDVVVKRAQAPGLRKGAGQKISEANSKQWWKNALEKKKRNYAQDKTLQASSDT